MTNIKAIGDNSGYWKKSTTTTKHLEPITILPEEETTIKQFVTDYFNNLYFLCPNGKIYESDHNNWKDKLKPVENIPVIKSIHSGYHHVFAMTDEEDPKIYGWGKNNYYQLGLPENKEYSKPTLLQYSKDINIHEIHPVGYASVFLDTERHILYGCGNNSSGQTSIDKNEGVIKTIQKSQDNVMRVFTGHAAHSYLIKSDGHLYAFGSNYGKFKIDFCLPLSIRAFPSDDMSVYLYTYLKYHNTFKITGKGPKLREFWIFELFQFKFGMWFLKTGLFESQIFEKNPQF
ncbi:hypothetical protein M0812_10169 [Anaeramoeba flamelloides]|uniref:Regulator of chromosome condensation protein n=1 Tax=Anaeramoeba flamelloides TaxID=1746091 RepID=A0AAV7ZQP1_9EUKA|nr:hypothetical protein M0812_10169 [Anaeramoeba flamelloides]